MGPHLEDIRKIPSRGHLEDIHSASSGKHPEVRKTSGRPPEITGEGENWTAKLIWGNLRIENKTRGVTEQGENPYVESG